jgi:hypothetical protein
MKVLLVPLVTLGNPVLLVLMVTRVPLVLPGLPVKLVQKVTMVLLVLLVLLVKKESLDTKELLGQQDLQAR